MLKEFNEVDIENCLKLYGIDFSLGMLNEDQLSLEPFDDRTYESRKPEDYISQDDNKGLEASAV